MNTFVSTSPNRRRRQRATTIVTSALLVALTGIGAYAGTRTASRGLVLLTADEAAKLRMSDGEWPPMIRSRAVKAGPRVVIEHPDVASADGAQRIELTVPARLVVRFEENGAPVDMTSLQVSAHKGFFSKSLTSLLKPYIRGTTLSVDQLQVPEGQFLVEIQITDTKGMETSESYRLQVNGP